VDGKKHGHGVLKQGKFAASLANVYVGQWQVDKRHGYGVCDDIPKGEHIAAKHKHTHTHMCTHTHVRTHMRALAHTQPFYGILSGTTRVSRHQKDKTRKVKLIWIYWSKRQ